MQQTPVIICKCLPAGCPRTRWTVCGGWRLLPVRWTTNRSPELAESSREGDISGVIGFGEWVGVKRGALPALSVFPPRPLRRASCWWIIGIPPWPSFRTARNLRLVNNPFLPRKGVVALSGVVDVEDSTTPPSWRDLPEPRKTCFMAELVVAERLRGLDARSATGGKADCKGNNENEHNDGHEIGERVRRAEA